MKRLGFALMIMTLSLIVISCNKDDEENTMTQKSLKLNLSNLADLGDAEQYEGWIIVDGAPVSTGTFTVNANGQLSKTDFMVDADKLENATDFVLSIEPIPDDSPSPSAIKILGGSFSGASADVSVQHGAALGASFSSASGKYILATPTTPTTEDELSGIWFLDLSTGMPAAGLDLPELPAGWAYEGWAVIDGMPVTSGTFTSVDMADDAAPYSDIVTLGPPFPGEDYVKNAPSGLDFPLDLSGSTLVISIEPSPDNSPAPFMFKPLVGMVEANAKDHYTYDFMNKVDDSFPMGTASR